MKRILIFSLLFLVHQILSAQFLIYSTLWINSRGWYTGEGTIISEHEFPFQPFKVKFDEKGWITDSSSYPRYEDYFIADIVEVSKKDKITAYLIGELTLCVECGYFVQYKKEIDNGSQCYFKGGGFYFKGEYDPAIKEFKKHLRKKVYLKKGFFEKGTKYYRTMLWNGRLNMF